MNNEDSQYHSSEKMKALRASVEIRILKQRLVFMDLIYQLLPYAPPHRFGQILHILRIIEEDDLAGG